MSVIIVIEIRRGNPLSVFCVVFVVLFVFVLCLVYPMLPVSLDCPFLIALSVLKGNQEWTIQRHWQHWVHKTQDKDKQNNKHNIENWKSNQEWTIQKHWQRWAHKTQNKDKQQCFRIVHSWLLFWFSLRFIQ
jgi:hypothetical protein